VAHACNPSYSGGRDQEDYGLKPASKKKKKRENRDGGVAQGVGPEFTLSTIKKKK
jgi:hypothetical protein